MLVGRSAHRGDRLANQSSQLHLPHRPRDLAGLDAGKLEEIVDEVAEDPDVGADLLQIAIAGLSGRDTVVDRLDQQPQRGERRAQVVGGIGDELAARRLDLTPGALLHREADGEGGSETGGGGGEQDQEDLVGAHVVRHGNGGGAGQEGGDGDDDGALHGRSL